MSPGRWDVPFLALESGVKMAVILKGTGVVPGVAVGNAVLWSPTASPTLDTPPGPPPAELSLLSGALDRTASQLREILNKIEARLGEAEARIFKTHLALLEDPMFLKPVKARIECEGSSALAAVAYIIAQLKARFVASSLPQLRERAADLEDVGNRILGNIAGAAMPEPLISAAGILCAISLAPSEISHLDRTGILGIALEEGSSTSHTTILARGLGIPMVVGVTDLMRRICEGESLVLNGDAGEIVTGADDEFLRVHRHQAELMRPGCSRAGLAESQAVTADGYRIEIGANIGNPAEVGAALAAGADDIGLFRTEFMFLNRVAAPSEEEQFSAYRETLIRMAPKRVVFRTVDAGADKPICFMKPASEPNPSLGLRAIRLSLREEAFFCSQIRALLRASGFGQMAILIPMITDISEIRRVREIIARLRRELEVSGTSIAGNIGVGAMIETPAAALTADILSMEADFFSIGTNDLTQYVCAADRLNRDVDYLYQPMHPAVLRLIREVVLAASRNGKWIGLCGEVASSPLAAPLLVGLGVNGLSMSPSLISPVKEAILRIKKTQADELAREALDLKTAQEVTDLLKRFESRQV